MAPSKRNCRIAQRIARTPKRARGAHTCSSCSRNVTVWQACSRHIQRRLNHRIRTGTPGVFNCLCIRLLFERIDA